jgi:hypothetical protein
MFSDNTSPLFGFAVKFEGIRACSHCGSKTATIGRGAGPHYGELRCTACSSHCGWLSQSTADKLETIINKFGAQPPIVFRCPP